MTLFYIQFSSSNSLFHPPSCVFPLAVRILLGFLCRIGIDLLFRSFFSASIYCSIFDAIWNDLRCRWYCCLLQINKLIDCYCFPIDPMAKLCACSLPYIVHTQETRPINAIGSWMFLSCSLDLVLFWRPPKKKPKRKIKPKTQHWMRDSSYFSLKWLRTLWYSFWENQSASETYRLMCTNISLIFFARTRC